MASEALHSLAHSVKSTATALANKVQDSLQPITESSTSNRNESVAEYLVRYLAALGVTKIFTVPGDFTLPLMRDVERFGRGRIKFICHTNELNAGYVADGYGRLHGFAVLLTTFSVGSLSAINAIAGYYCEHIPVLVLCGGPNSNTSIEGELVHHALGEVRYDYSRAMHAHVTVKTAVVTRAVDTPVLLHEAVEACLTHKQPVYLEIASNLSSENVWPAGALTDELEPIPELVSMSEMGKLSDSNVFNSAVQAAMKILNAASRPAVIVGGLVRLMQYHARYIEQSAGSAKPTGVAGLTPLLELLENSSYAFAAMNDAKAMISEHHPSFVGIYTGAVGVLPGHPELSGSLTVETINSADAVMMVGCVQSDYATAGHSWKLPAVAQVIEVFPEYVKVGGRAYHRVLMRDFLSTLASHPYLRKNPALIESFHQRLQSLTNAPVTGSTEVRHSSSELPADASKRIDQRASKYPLTLEPAAPLTIRSLVHQLQSWIDHSAGIPSATTSTAPASTSPVLPQLDRSQVPAHCLVDCGDSWFTGLKLRLPAHGSFVMQLQYGSLGYGVGAALGYHLALKDNYRDGRLIAIVGDGAFQMSPQEISSHLRYNSNAVIFIINNNNYLVENEIVEGDYNDLINWDYVKLCQSMQNHPLSSQVQSSVGSTSASLLALRVSNNQELLAAFMAINGHAGLCVVEVMIDRNDCNAELTEWAAAIHPSATRTPRV